MKMMMKCLFRNIHDGIADRQLLFMTNEACFIISGCINSKNIYHTIRDFLEIPLRGRKAGV